ncbi:MAG TPA: hypothetical protein VN175_06355 [Rhizomicrobium sp.]|nr:hypothetical protein [Rhizomicrobium sp.]
MNIGAASIGAVIALASAPALAEPTVLDAITAGRPVIDLRARYENVDDVSKTPDRGTASTLRARLGYETGVWNGLSLQGDFDQVWLLGGDYNSTRNGKTAYPVIADPAMTSLNRLQLSYASDFDTKFVVGRQRILIGNTRFIGNAGWRQHEQTFDALSAVNTSIPDLTFTYAYLYRINRVNGPEPPSPSNTPAAAAGQANYFKSDSNVINAVYSGLPGLRLESYAYLLNLSAPGYATLPAQQAAAAKLSTQTYGLRADVTLPLPDGFGGRLTGEFANQSNYAGNPLSFDLNYYLAEATVTYQGIKALAGYEILEGNGAIGFSTPLASLHGFNGWADMFLTTPANGLKDLYVQAAYSLPADAIGMKTFTPSVAYHSYATTHLDAGIGSEWDAQGEFVVDASLSFLLKYADYQGSGTAFGGFADKSIFWLQTAWKY